jgi:hypothetical protein
MCGVPAGGGRSEKTVFPASSVYWYVVCPIAAPA